MTERKRLERLTELAEMKRQHDMARLSRLAQACDETRARIDALHNTQPPTDDPAMFAVQQAHRAWANVQRMALNQTLAQQTARMLEQRAKTARSFGRAEALSEMSARLRLRQRSTHSP